MSHEIIKGLIFSVFEDEGPIPVVTFPEDMDEVSKLTIAMKSISLLMGDQIYQGGDNIDSIRYYGILPFPDYKLTSLTYFFLIADENARGHAKAATCSLLIDENRNSFIYDNMKDLSVYFSETVSKIHKDLTIEEIKEIMQILLEKIKRYIDNVQRPIESTRMIKILFTGLDASGKTSFLRAIRQRYSELTGIQPTKGIERTEETILGIQLSEWDIGGQMKYRQNFLKQADLYLYDTNLLLFLIDIKNPERFAEANNFLNQILQILRNFKQFPPVIICLHKYDPDIQNESEMMKNIQNLEQKIPLDNQDFRIQFFKTSIFNVYSLNKAFSNGINALSPNREILRGQLQWLSQKTKAKAMILVNDNNIILSDYSENEESRQISEVTAPHFKNLYKTFADFKFLRRKSAIWRMEDVFISFISFNLKNDEIYLLSIHQNQETDLSLLNSNIPEFKKRILPLIQSYL